MSAETCWTLKVPEARCCFSCHEDEDLGYALIMDYDLADGRSAYLCCGGKHWAKQEGLL